ncbi:MAG: toxin-antitoxin system VapC family toxin component [Phormidesmis priestleyi Ana]|uniref:Toxin-antitoxin system VapC family toxin component n=1 Tax=Phormidesmis priestleyi Ana TaxID=1666911 RepID=A0A0P7ZXX5_9CYAN|nr:MAG: toxin-antitoxin system VapC family toxin component [Phormidesmis priestleyi Ana]
MIILDTNVLSELMNLQGSVTVKAWIKSQSRDSLFVTTITQAEVLYGIALLPEGNRRQRLFAAAQAMFKEDFADKIMPFCQKSAEQFAIVASHRRRQGNPISQFDAQIAAICHTHQATIATRNVKDFIDCHINLINPWAPETTISKTSL